ncbi:hypothetical protein H5410_000937 [Solanum commersonii]|uniref:U-box domain-containing protein n=1 Tax=Solanum commersonii TaxID=4109 RepID=A0A9J6AXN6_SOLCO|nr:hypothetical protein H5410_000937 [Solanum commersonii]
MEEVEIPQYFLCPISLMIMKDPVTTVTGITYDRESIEMWLLTAEEEAMTTTCPVTKQNLPRDIELLTPNHMLRRIIQAWCIANASMGIDRIPTPKYPLNKSHILRLVRQVNNDKLCVEALRKIDVLVIENNEKNKKCLEEVGAIKAMVTFIVKSYKERKLINGLEEALRIFHLVWSSTIENIQLVKENRDIIEAISWILKSDMTKNQVVIKTQAMMVLKNVTEVSKSEHHISQQATKGALQVLIHACPWGRNKHKIIESGAIFELIELELGNTEKRVSELVLCVLAHLCTLADGRAEFLKHAGGLSVVAKRTLRVSSSTDDCAIQIFGSISRCSATKEVLMEMLRVGVVSKLCMVIQASCGEYLKKKAMEILKTHSNVWSNSPCIQVYLLTRYPGQ